MNQSPPEQPDAIAGVAFERTTLAWERTAIAFIANGLLLTRHAGSSTHWTIAVVGLAETMAGAALLAWTGLNTNKLHGPRRAEDPVTYPRLTRMVGLLAVLFTGAGLTLAVLIAVVR